MHCLKNRYVSNRLDCLGTSGVFLKKKNKTRQRFSFPRLLNIAKRTYLSPPYDFRSVQNLFNVKKNGDPCRLMSGIHFSRQENDPNLQKKWIILLKKLHKSQFSFVIYLSLDTPHLEKKTPSMFKGDRSKCQIMGIIMAQISGVQ